MPRVLVVSLPVWGHCQSRSRSTERHLLSFLDGGALTLSVLVASRPVLAAQLVRRRASGKPVEPPTDVFPLRRVVREYLSAEQAIGRLRPVIAQVMIGAVVYPEDQSAFGLGDA